MEDRTNLKRADNGWDPDHEESRENASIGGKTGDVPGILRLGLTRIAHSSIAQDDNGVRCSFPPLR